MSHIDTFDLKPDHKNQGATRPMSTKVDGIRVSSHLPNLARHADKLCVVNSLTSTAGDHEKGNYFIHTSYEQRATIRHPGLGAWAQRTHGKLNSTMPGSVFIGKESRFHGSGGFFEPAFEPLAISEPRFSLKYSHRNVRTVEVSYSGWDTHADNFTAMPLLCSTMDRAVRALLDDLQRVGKLDDTVVVLTTEFGRTPISNQNSGRDHYPQAFTSVLAGGGFKGGYVYGKTSQDAEEVVENPVTIPDFNATTAYALGIPIKKELFA